MRRQHPAWRLLVAEATLLAHRAQWVPEPAPARRLLTRLNLQEQALRNRLTDVPEGWPAGQGVRLEQELIRFGWLMQALPRLLDCNKLHQN